MEKPPTPTLDKMLAVKDKSQIIGNFLEWLGEEGIELAQYHKHKPTCYDCKENRLCQLYEGDLIPIHLPSEKVAQYFDIDLNEAEREKRKILEMIQDANKNY